MSKECFEVEFNNEQITQKLENLKKSFSDLAPFFKIIRTNLLNEIEENFNTEGTNSGEKWAEWSEKYKKLRIKLGKSSTGVILSDSGQLRESFFGEIEANKLTIGTAKEYAAIHNFGHDKKNMPQREYFRFSDNAIDGLLADINDYAKELLTKGIT